MSSDWESESIKVSSPRMKQLLQKFESLQKHLSESPKRDWDYICHLTTKMNEVTAMIMYEENHEKFQHMKEQTCPICEKPFMGWGNNPAPIPVDGNVCDWCNEFIIFPVRMGHKKVEKYVMCILARNKSKK